MNPAICVELAYFQLRADKTQAQLTLAAERLQAEFLRQQPGFLSHELLHLNQAQHLDVVRWRHADDAKAAMALIHQSESAQAYFSLMDLTSVNPNDQVTLATRLYPPVSTL